MDGEKKEREQKRKINIKTPKAAKIIAFSLLCALVVLIIGCQMYIKKGGNSLLTEIAFSESVVKSIPVDMFIVRDEKIITSGNANVVSAVRDGTRVSANDTVAYSFADNASAGNVVRMKEIEELLNYYHELENKSATVANDTTLYDNRITDGLCNLSAALSSGDLTALGANCSEIRDAITSKQTATGVKLDLSESIRALESEYSSLMSSSSVYSEIKAGSPGYYIQGVDGYEGILDYSQVDSWTIEDAQKAFAFAGNAPQSTAVGRIVRGYYWYLVCVVDLEDINTIEKGDYINISFPDSSVSTLRTQVYAIKIDGSTKKALVVFRCNAMNEDIASLRCESALINIKNYKGYRIDNDAVRVNEDGEKGVYVVSGSVIRFKKINIVYSTEDYSIVTNPFKNDAYEGSKYLKLYDEYIISGSDLYDGKLID